MKYVFLIFFALSISISCSNSEDHPEILTTPISGVDLSSFPEISETNPQFFDLDGEQRKFLNILKENGINTVRLRLWVTPKNEHSGFTEVKNFAQVLKENGFKTWLSLHYSDTWADPGNQETPEAWQELSFEELKDTVYEYTTKVIQEIAPDYIQIGNEINNGMLHPYGDLSSNYQNLVALLKAGSSAVRASSVDCKIIIHFAGIENANWFFNQISEVDYDIIGLSYYPLWHGKSLQALNNVMNELSQAQNKQIVIAETAYPFTLEWNDWTNNIIGSQEQIISPEYPATPQGQRMFIKEIKAINESLDQGIGFCYWGGELIAWKTTESTDGSPWENQALFDFDNKALPVLIEFK
ncbi:MAG: glycoside hydrolase family 53 protein [Flavobacteriaceae bacterium]